MSELLRVADIAQSLGLGKSRVYALIACKEIPSVRVGGAIRVPRYAWEEWLRTKGQEAIAGLQQDTPDDALGTEVVA